MQKICSWTMVLLLATVTAAAQGPISRVYLTGVKVTCTGNEYWIEVLQGSSVVNGWQEYGTGLPSPTLESAIAVTQTIKTVGGSICSGGCAAFPVYVAAYTLSGSFLAASTITVPD